MTEKTKVLIVGAGPTGLVMAHELARDGIQCRLIDKAPHRAMESRAIAIHSRTMESFELMGLADDFLAVGQRIAGVNLFGGKDPIAHVDFGSLETRYPGVLGVPQDETERLLGQRVAKLGLTIERNTELVGLSQRGSGVSARLHKGGLIEEIDADWVMGCDGAHSAVREQLGIPFSGSTYPEHFVLADIKLEGEVDHNQAQVWLAADGPLAFFPLPEDRWRLIIINSPPDWKGQPSLAQCQQLLNERGLTRLRLADPRWTAVFRIHRRKAGQFRQGRVFLLGDAAHIHSPVGGQGMNMGIQDAFNLAWKLSLIVRNIGDQKLLDSYEAERKPVDEAVIRQTDRATRLVSLHGTVTRFIRDHMMSLLTRLPGFEERLGEGISGIAVNYRHSPIVEDHAGRAGGLAAGDRAPDAPVTAARGGTAQRLYELFAQHRHVLLLLGDPEANMAATPPRYPEEVFSKYQIVPAGISGGDYVDRDGVVARRYGSAPAIYLIRPDGYVGFRGDWDSATKRLPNYLAALFPSAGTAC
ncbi:MAG: FAD-dependent monooxygenase [Alphaproteobacteria bacterium]|nr:FAD-dependent monooxygenase [Alphaproteobacteria bacterium]